MKSKLFLVGASLLACSVAWMGCSSSTTSGAAVTDGGTGNEGGSSEGGSTTEAGTDAGVDSSVAVEITGPFIDIQYKGCTPLAACGGDVQGLWNLTGGCVDDGAFAAAKGQCPGLVESNVKFQARGVVFANATNITRKTEVKFTATLAVPKVCKDAIGTCADVANAVKFTGIANATCTDVAADMSCSCDVGDSTTENTSDTYSTSGNTLTSGARTFDYCVAGSEIKYKETTAKAIPAVFTLTK
jgi:hypothetical protein